MPDDPMDFSFDTRGMDRGKLLQEAAQLLDASRHSHLGPGQATGVASTEGDAVRELALDHASLAPSLTPYKITDRDFINQKRPVPVRFQRLTEKSSFYWLTISVGLLPRRGWAFNRLEVKLVFNPGADPAARPKSWQVLPDRKLETQLKLGTRLEVNLNENFEFAGKVALPANVAGAVQASAAADVTSAAGMGLVAGPFEYRVTCLKIDQNGPGMDWVFWRLDGAEFVEENRPDLVVIVEVPKHTTAFTVEAKMQAYRYFKFFGADLREAVKGLPQKLRALFEGGLPVFDHRTYDLTKDL